jgi:hypothetical protein
MGMDLSPQEQVVIKQVHLLCFASSAGTHLPCCFFYHEMMQNEAFIITQADAGTRLLALPISRIMSQNKLLSL